MHRRLVAAATLSVALLVSACTDDAPQPPPPPSGGPKVATSSPTSLSPTPSPSPSVDQDAADKAAVEKAYRTQFAEFNRLEMAGGATKLTKTLLNTTSGEHRRHYLMWLREDKETGQRQLNPAKLVGVTAGSGTSTRRKVTACEDYSDVKWVRHGKPFKPNGTPRSVQRATALKGKDGKWRIDLIRTTAVKEFPKTVCG